MTEHMPLPRLPSMIVLTSAIVVCIIVLYLIAQPFIPALVWSLTLAVMFAPVGRRLRARLRSPGLAAALTLTLAAIVVVIPVVAVSVALINEVIAGAGSFGALASPEGLANLRHGYPQIASFLGSLGSWLDLPQVLRAFTTRLGDWSADVVQGSASGLVNLLLTFYFLFYLLRDKDRALEAIERMVPLSHEEFASLIERTVQTVFASVYATVAVAALQGFLAGLMFWILDLPSPAFWGVVMGLLAIVPFLGAFVVWAPTALALALAGQWVPALILAAWGTLVVGLIDNVVYPILVGRRISLHPLLSFIAIVGGLILFGAHGIVLGPLVVALAQALQEIWRTRLDRQQRPGEADA